ncbi:MAG: phosphatase PAP2 family protein [Campylobacteraceae bacterium]
MVDFIYKQMKCFTPLRVVSIIFALLLIAILPILFGFAWSPEINNNSFIYLFYIVTNTANFPITFLTSLIFSLILFLAIKLPFKKVLLLLIFFNVMVIGSQLCVYGIKHFAKEPRPYTVWLSQNNFIESTDAFYKLSKKEKIEIIKSFDFKDFNISSWQQNYWTKEVGYSFPSGHSVFAASWAVIMFIFLFQAKRYKTAFLILLWAVIVESSRMLLGMHFPNDILVSCLVSLCVILLFVYLLKLLRVKSKDNK